MFYIYPNKISSEKCDELLEGYLKKHTFEEAKIKKESHQVPDASYRRCKVAFIEPARDFLHETIDDCITNANDNYFNYNIRTLEPVQFAKYEVGEYYHWHQDYRQTDNGISRKLTFVVSLSDCKDYEGGHLEFFESHGKASGFSSVFIDGKTIEEEKVRDLAWSKGTVLVFCSRDWHRVTPITKGVRYSLVSWILGPNLV
ncbi:MAG: 2OG-Fe(II) oxygenase [Candidatus Pacebacteria bacterium]|jgi:PKHD-type hydroxylase|nr:2OG-Fe(II) oxygenase [Candidatus Paceibacterota bacterium]